MLNAYLNADMAFQQLPMLLQYRLLDKLLSKSSLMNAKQNVTIWYGDCSIYVKR